MRAQNKKSFPSFWCHILYSTTKPTTTTSCSLRYITWTFCFLYFSSSIDFSHWSYLLLIFVHLTLYPLFLQLRSPVFLNDYVSIILLPRFDAAIPANTTCRVSGWGYTSPTGGTIPSTLRTVTLPIIPSAKCNSSASFNGRITENMLCAGYELGGKDACQVRGPL